MIIVCNSFLPVGEMPIHSANLPEVSALTFTGHSRGKDFIQDHRASEARNSDNRSDFISHVIIHDPFVFGQLFFDLVDNMISHRSTKQRCSVPDQDSRPDGWAVHQAGCRVRRSAASLPQGPVRQARVAHHPPPRRLGRRHRQWPGRHRCRGALRQRGGDGRERGAAAARRPAPEGPVPPHPRRRRRLACRRRPRRGSRRRGQRRPHHGGRGGALVRPPGVLRLGAAAPAEARRRDRGLGVQLPRQPRGGHDGALPPHHPALLGLQSSVRDRRVPGPAVPVRRRRPREGGRACGLRHGARDSVPWARRHADVVVGGGDGEAAGRGPAGRARGEAAGGRVGWRVAGPQGHLQGVPACRHRQGRRSLIERLYAKYIWSRNADVKNGVLL